VKRLVERELPPQSVEGEAATLLAAVPPHEAAPGMKQRVRTRLLAAPVERRRPGVRLVLVLAILAVASVAAAAVGTLMKKQRELAERGRASAPVSQVGAATTASAVERLEPGVASENPPETPPPSEAPATTPPASETPSIVPSGASRSASKTTDELTEANLLLDATRALRHDGNPARAAELLAQYQKKFPRGALAEEALARSVESAAARGDARATTLAKRYLKLYPNGHFVAKAKRALEQDGE